MRNEKKVKKTPDQKLTDRVRHIMQKMHVAGGDLSKEELVPFKLDMYYGVAVLAHLSKMNPSTLGEIATLLPKDMFPGSLPVFLGGELVLLTTAKLSVLCRMCELLKEEKGLAVQRIRSEILAKEVAKARASTS